MIEKNWMTGMRLRMLMVTTLVLAGMLAVSFGMAAATPQTAHASGKTKVLVVKKEKLNEGGYTSTTTYEYNKKGLLTAEKESAAGTSYTFRYDKKYRLKSATNTWGSGSSDKSKTTYSLNNKGYVGKSTEQYGSESFATQYTYNSKGRLTKETTVEGVVKYSYDKKGRLKSRALEWGTDELKYDKKGRIKSVVHDTYDSTTDKGTYKSGRLSKITSCYADGTKISTRTFTYKKISVPKKYAKMVKAQQAALLWEILPLEAAHR